jgi:hypothetical protein
MPSPICSPTMRLMQPWSGLGLMVCKFSVGMNVIPLARFLTVLKGLEIDQ